MSANGKLFKTSGNDREERRDARENVGTRRRDNNGGNNGGDEREMDFHEALENFEMDAQVSRLSSLQAIAASSPYGPVGRRTSFRSRDAREGNVAIMTGEGVRFQRNNLDTESST